MYISDKLIKELSHSVESGLSWDATANLFYIPRFEFLELITTGRKYPDTQPGRMVAALEQATLDYKKSCQPGQAREHKLPDRTAFLNG